MDQMSKAMMQTLATLMLNKRLAQHDNGTRRIRPPGMDNSRMAQMARMQLGLREPVTGPPPMQY